MMQKKDKARSTMSDRLSKAYRADSMKGHQAEADAAGVKINLPERFSGSPDPRIILVSPFDPSLACFAEWDSTHCQVRQGHNGPTYLVIGPIVTDDSLQRASECFGIPLDDLMAFQAANDDATKFPIWQPVVGVVTPEGANEFEAIGKPMAKKNAWEVARAAMDSRTEVVFMSVRRTLHLDSRPAADPCDHAQ